MNTRWRNLGLLLVLAVLWGPSFLFIKVAVHEIPPITLVIGRVGLAGFLLYTFLRLQGGKMPPFGKAWIPMCVMGILQSAFPFVLQAWGEQHVTSALASILNGFTPISTIVLAHFFTEDDRLSSPKVLGVLLGFVGLGFLVGPSLLEGQEATVLGILAIIVSTMSYAVALLYARRSIKGYAPIVLPTGQLLTAAFILIPIALIVESPFSIAPSWQAVGSLLGLSVFGTAVAFVLFYKFVESAPPSYISMVTYVVPVFGVCLGVFVLGEQLTWHTFVGFGLVLVGILFVNGIFRLNRRRPHYKS